MKKIEILSPVGSKEALKAAVEAGCDAIYLGGTMFGARSFANNFSNEELIEVINYVHLYGIRVYVTCNILIYEQEVNKFMEFIHFLYTNHVDAIIVQDLGMLDLIHKTYPKLEIHASTQMHIHNLDGAIIASKLGVKRVVLARETPIEVVREIKEKTNLEIEIFVHGALCVSYSGMCLFASSIGNRSGNRGTCSGCCRLPYNILDKDNYLLNKERYPLSMKDLNTLEYLYELVEAGVDSLKIEGRMKGPSYVYLATKLYRDVLDNYYETKEIKINDDDLLKLEIAFNRGYTKGFLFNEENNNVINMKRPNHQGIEIGHVVGCKNDYLDIKLSASVSIHDGIRILLDDEDYGLLLNEFYIKKELVKSACKGDIISIKINKEIPINSLVLKTLDSKLEIEINKIIDGNMRKVDVSIFVNIKRDLPVEIILSDYYDEIKVFGSIPDIAKTREVIKEDIIDKLNKIGNTIYRYQDLTIELDPGLFVSMKEINDLRRKAFSLLDEKRLKRMEKDYSKAIYTIEVPDFDKEEKRSLLTNNKNLIIQDYDIFYSENNEDNSILKLPKVMDNYDNYNTEKEYLVGELGALNKLSNIICDYSFNVTNSYTVALLHSLGVKRITLSIELLDKQIETLIREYINRYRKKPNLELIVSTNIEVMVSKFNLIKYYPKTYYLEDRFYNKYRLINKNNLMYIYDYKKTIRDNKDYYKMGINYLRDEEYE